MTLKFFNDPEKLMKLTTLMGSGAVTACAIFLLTLLLALPLGVPVALLRMSKNRVVNKLTSLYIYIMRSTPLMLQIMFIYYLMPQVLPFKFDRFWAVIFAFVINYAAYFAEIFRGGIQSISVGQYEAGHVLGYTKFQVFMRIIAPQVVKRVMPSITNEVITLVKDTALASTVAITEIMMIAKQQSSSAVSTEPFMLAMIFYLILNGVTEQLCKLAERKLNYY